MQNKLSDCCVFNTDSSQCLFYDFSICFFKGHKYKHNIPFCCAVSISRYSVRLCVWLKNLIRTIKERNAFINDSISISVDRITDLYANCNQTSSESRAYQLTLEHYSRRTKKNVCVPTINEFRKLREGDRCILVFCKGNKEPVAIYPGNEYVIDKSLTDKIVDF